MGGGGQIFFPLSVLSSWKDLDILVVLWEGTRGEREVKKDKKQEQSLGRNRKGMETQNPDGHLHMETGENRRGMASSRELAFCVASSQSLNSL